MTSNIATVINYRFGYLDCSTKHNMLARRNVVSVFFSLFQYFKGHCAAEPLVRLLPTFYGFITGSSRSATKIVFYITTTSTTFRFANIARGKGVRFLNTQRSDERAGGSISFPVTIPRTKYVGLYLPPQKSAEKQYFNSSK